MVRGNWQRRVEKTEARRAAAKQRKQRQSDRSKNSLKGKELLAFLDQHTETLREERERGECVLHVWVDSVPAGAAPLLDKEDDELIPTGKRRGNNKARSNSSTNNEKEMTKGGGGSKRGGRGGRSNSTSTTAHHPRSKHKDDTAMDKPDTEETTVPRLCRQYFFTGKYQENQRKSGGCLQVHYLKKQETLAAILGGTKHTKRKQPLSKRNNNNDASFASSSSSYQWKEQLDQAAEAAAAFEMEDTEEDVGMMDMLYYFPIQVGHHSKQDENEKYPLEQQNNMSEIVSRSLSSKSCSMGSIVYVAINNYMLFDRHRNGIVMSEMDLSLLRGGNASLFQSAVLMSTTATATTTATSGTFLQNTTTHNTHNNNTDTDSHHDHHLADMLPGPLLEHIVSFLPDSSGILMCCVCRSWYQEIGQSSPSLWRTLLQQRGWPLPPTNTTIAAENDDDDENENVVAPISSLSSGTKMNAARNLFRNNFVAHYKAVRDINAIQVALPTLLGLTRVMAEEKEMVFQAFLTRRGAPQQPNACSSVKVWSSKRVLASYEYDCTLRLFEVIEKSHNSHNHNNHSRDLLRGCREVVCFRAAPYQNTKKRTCVLVGMDLDDEMIGCLCHVNKMDEIEGYYLVVVSREEFLCSGGGTLDASVGSTDGSIFCSINIGEAVLHYLLSLSEIDHRLVRLYNLLADSGGELPDVQIVASRNVVACGYGRFMVEVSIWIPDETEEFQSESVLLDRKLVLLSTSTEAVVWMGDSNLTQIQPRLDDVRIVREISCSSAVGRSTRCSLAVASSWSPYILTVDIEPTGHVESVEIIETSEQAQFNMLQDDWEVGDMGNGHRCRPIVITLSDVIVADNLHRENDGHTYRKSVLSFYSRGTPDCAPSLLTLDFECETIQMLQLRDHHIILICRSYDYEDREKIEGVVVSVASRNVIHRVCLLEDATNLPPAMFDHDIPILLAADKDTVGVGVSWTGMILTGQDIRSVGRCSVESQHDVTHVVSKSASKKKKKKRQSGKGNKKDGFARGMSLRG